MNKYDNKPYLIIVDDEPNFCESLQIALEDTFTVSTANSIKKTARTPCALGTGMNCRGAKHQEGL